MGRKHVTPLMMAAMWPMQPLANFTGDVFQEGGTVLYGEETSMTPLVTVAAWLGVHCAVRIRNGFEDSMFEAKASSIKAKASSL